VLPVPEFAINWKGRQKVRFLSEHARKAAALSAGYAGIRVESMAKNDQGVPLPFQGSFWSVTHKSLYVAGVVATKAIGIDIEKIRSVSDGLFKKTAHDTEWNLGADPRCLNLFFQFWTAKEAVLKATGEGISGLLQCKVVQISDSTHLILYHRDQFWRVEHRFFDGHIVSVVQHDCRIKWIVDPGCDL
jgi:4'-phosphopantetheinyl transferase